MRLAVPLLAIAGSTWLVGEEDQIAFQRPESWAMASAAWALAPSPTRAIPEAQAGTLSVGGDAAYLRRFSTREEQVGFEGTAPESMNRTPVLGDLRLEAGAPGGVQVVLGWTPPVYVQGIRADVATLALERQCLHADHFRLGLRVFGAIGQLSGDITSDQATADAPGGSAGNPLDTDGESHDKFNWRMAGIDLLATEQLDQAGTSPSSAASRVRSCT